VLAKLHDLGVEAKSHMSAVDDKTVDLLRGKLAPKTPAAPKAKVKPAAPAAPKPRIKPAAHATPKPEPAAAPAVPAPPPEPVPLPETPQADEHDKPGATVAGEGTVVRVKGSAVVRDLAERLNIRPNQLIAELMKMNVLASINERIDINVARKIAEKHGFTLEHEKRTDRKPILRTPEEDEHEEADRDEDLMPRPPVVTFLGHVDHGKTSLLDKIRDTSVVDDEFGGITQHIGAYTVEVSGRRITFLDTPGHAAFTAMRARGANLTDIAVVVIAADDGIMPQTQEAIRHVQAADVPMMIAINKTDLPTANVGQVKQQLQAANLAPEEWGGSTICCEVSAETGAGLDHLLEMILLQADILELKANPEKRAKGYVIEARLEPGMGPTTHMLVTRGTLKVGDMVLCGSHFGRVRALINDHGVKVKAATPSMPIKCLGLSGVPEAGAEFTVYANEKSARQLANGSRQRTKAESLSAPRKASLDNLFEQMLENDRIELKLVLKADTQGSVEAITHALEEIKSDKVSLNILLGGTGNITGNDVMLASASNAIVMGFHVGKESGVDAAAKHEGVEIRLHQIIYEMLDEVKAAMLGLLDPEISEKLLGHAEIRQVFSLSRRGKVAGCLVVDGVARAGAKVRVKRGKEVLYEGGIMTLKHFQDDVPEVREAQECGVRLTSFSDFEEGDVIEFYDLEKIDQTL